MLCASWRTITKPRYFVEMPPSTALKTILLVDGQDDCRITTKWFLTSFGYAVDSVQGAEQALALFDPKVHDLVVTDNSMSGMTGAEMAHIIKLRSPSTSEEHTSELQSRFGISYAVFCLKKK